MSYPTQSRRGYGPGGRHGTIQHDQGARAYLKQAKSAYAYYITASSKNVGMFVPANHALFTLSLGRHIVPTNPLVHIQNLACL